MTKLPRLVFWSWGAESYRRGGWDVTEVRPGVWQVRNPRAEAREAAKAGGKGKK